MAMHFIKMTFLLRRGDEALSLASSHNSIWREGLTGGGAPKRAAWQRPKNAPFKGMLRHLQHLSRYATK